MSAYFYTKQSHAVLTLCQKAFGTATTIKFIISPLNAFICCCCQTLKSGAKPAKLASCNDQRGLTWNGFGAWAFFWTSVEAAGAVCNVSCFRPWGTAHDIYSVIILNPGVIMLYVHVFDFLLTSLMQDNFSGYEFEARLNFKVHSAMGLLRWTIMLLIKAFCVLKYQS